MRELKRIVCCLLVLTVIASAQKTKKTSASKSQPATNTAAAEDISGTYSFLKEGEFVQINLEQSGVSGYISRQGELESDRGQFLDQFFSKAVVSGHDISFTTKPLHGIWFEFKGRFERGPADSKAKDAYYIIHGTLTEFRADAENKTTSRSREVEFKWMARPEES
jgi:hypothetical protein